MHLLERSGSQSEGEIDAGGRCVLRCQLAAIVRTWDRLASGMKCVCTSRWLLLEPDVSEVFTATNAVLLDALQYFVKIVRGFSSLLIVQNLRFVRACARIHDAEAVLTASALQWEKTYGVGRKIDVWVSGTTQGKGVCYMCARV